MGSKQILKRELVRAFFLEYYQNGHNGAKAYMEVVPTASYNTAKVTASKWLKQYPEMIDQIVREIEFATKNAVISVADRKIWLSDVVLQRNPGVRCGMKERIAALKELNKMDGIGDDNAKVNVTITPEEQKEAYKELLDNQFGAIDAEYKEKEDGAS